MTYDRFDFTIYSNDDSRILTVLVIGTAANVDRYILSQYSYGFAKVTAWSPIQPVPNSPGKVMTLLSDHASRFRRLGLPQA